MSEAEYQNPVDLAIQKLKSRLETDKSLPPNVMLATIADLASDSPHEFVNLKEILEGVANDPSREA